MDDTAPLSMRLGRVFGVELEQSLELKSGCQGVEKRPLSLYVSIGSLSRIELVGYTLAVEGCDSESGALASTSCALDFIHYCLSSSPPYHR